MTEYPTRASWSGAVNSVVAMRQRLDTSAEEELYEAIMKFAAKCNFSLREAVEVIYIGTFGHHPTNAPRR